MSLFSSLIIFSIDRLAQEREAFLRNKRLHQEEMKAALDNQVNISKMLFHSSLFFSIKIGSK
jgi:hypothetical protein